MIFSAPFPALVLISLRIAIPFITAPIQFSKLLPYSVRFGLIFTFALSIYWDPFFKESEYNLLNFSLGCFNEVINGLILSFALTSITLCIELLGLLLDNQMGLNGALLYNPNLKQQDSLFATFINLLCLVVFFSAGMPIKLLHFFRTSFISVPLGNLIPIMPMRIMQQLKRAFNFAFSCATPIVFFLMLMELMSCFFAKTLTQFSSYFLLQPVKILLGLMISLLLFQQFHFIFHSLFSFCEQFLGELCS